MAKIRTEFPQSGMHRGFPNLTLTLETFCFKDQIMICQFLFVLVLSQYHQKEEEEYKRRKFHFVLRF